LKEGEVYKKLIIVIGFFCLMTGVLAAEKPEAVSPGNDLRATVIDQVCPTFSWAQVPGSASYKIAVFEMSERFEGLSYYENLAALGNPVLAKKISGTASSWTPSLEEALQNGGRYVWFVQAQDAYGTGAWSFGKKFAVRASLGLTEIKEKVREKLEAHGIEEDVIEKALEGIETEGIETKEGGELKGKIQSGVKEEAQTKIKAQGNKEIRSKIGHTIADSIDFSAGTLGSEDDGNKNVYYGSGAGFNLGSGAYHNCFFGYEAGASTNTGDYNAFLGYKAGHLNSSGYRNVFMGEWAGGSNTTGYLNTFIGSNSGFLNSIGNKNTFIGYDAGYQNYDGCENTLIGYYTGHQNISGNENTMLGYYAGFTSPGSGNVFLGNKAGYNETGSNKLYIENTSSSSPLIYGEFDNDLVTINGELNVTESNINVDTTSTRARFKLQADGGGVNQDDYFNFTMRNDYGDVTLSVRDSSTGVWLPMLSYEYLNSKVDFKDNDIVTTGTISSGGGAYTSGGAWIEASSREFKENIMELDQEESLQALERLNPVRYNYKNKRDEEFLGFIGEDVPDLVAMNGRKGMRAMDIVAVLTKVAQNQQRKISEQKKSIEELREFIHDQNEINKKQDGLIIKQEEILRKQGQLINELKERIKVLEHK
jgi:hypothetical protein